MFLASFCKKVTIIHRSNKLSATDTYIQKLESYDNINLILNNSIESFEANDKETDIIRHINADGVFIFIGLLPNTSTFKSLLNLSQSGHILTKGLNQTNVEGIFSAGDCRFGAIAQVAAATGEGVVASYGVKEYLRKK